jgi:uncharacterized protein
LKILIDIGHPAHVHLFRFVAKELEKDGHTVLFTCRVKECTAELLTAFGFKFLSFGKPYKRAAGKAWGLVRFNVKMLRVLLRVRPDITLGHSSMYAAQMSWLLGIPHISMEDTGNMEQVRLYKPFTKAILVPGSFHLNLGKKQLRYAGNHELAYLHPNRYTPDPAHPFTGSPVYSLLRFVAWHASHDKGHPGISDGNKQKAVEAFSRFGKVYISSEDKLPDDLEPFRLSIRPEKLHDVIASASLVYGESATVASEACMLGVPAIYVDSTGRCYTREEEEKYGMVFNFTESQEDQEKSILKGVELLSTAGIKEEWQRKREIMLNDKIDVTAFLVWFVENWPRSLRIMKETPGGDEFPFIRPADEVFRKSRI